MGSLSVETRRYNLWLQSKIQFFQKCVQILLLTLLIFLFSSAPGSFVDMYEREDYFYIFMREKASESSTDSSSQVRDTGELTGVH